VEHDLVLEGKVVTKSGLLETEVGVSAGVIEAMGHGLKGARRIRTGRCLIFPGFVDIHVHLREPGWEHKEDFRTGSRAAVHGGVTTLVDMPNNPAPANSKAAIEAKRRLASEKSLVDVKLNGGVDRADIGKVLSMAADVVGYKVYLSETTGAGAFPPSLLQNAFARIAETGHPVSVHCEDQAILERVSQRLQGSVEPDLHADLRPPESEVGAVRSVAGALRSTRALRANICHASTGETLGLARSARAEGLRLYCEATLHHLYYNRRAMLDNKLLKTNPPLRSEDDRQALLNGTKNGEVSFLVTDHAPHTEEEKIDGGLAGVPGLDDYAHLVTWLVKDQGVDPPTIARITSYNPAKFFDMADRGSIERGLRADFSVIDLHSPEVVSRDLLCTKCGWSPYEGREFPGRAKWTVVRGEVLLDEFEMVR